MVWVRLDDHFDEHPKFAKAGPLGMALWVAGLAYCNRTATDGYIPWSVARTLISWEFLRPLEERGRKHWTIRVKSGLHTEEVSPEFVVGLLVEAGLWDGTADGGYVVHDYAKYQPTREQAAEERAQKRAAGQAGGQASAQARARAPAQAPSQAESKQTLKQNSSRRSSRTQADAQAESNPGPGPGDAGPSAPSVSPGPPVPIPNPNDGRPFEAAPRGAVGPPNPDPDPLSGRRANGTNSRALGTNPRALGTNPRTTEDAEVPASPQAVAAAMEKLYGPPVRPERLPNGAQQCPLCPDIFTCSYSEHLDSPRHKIRPVADDLRGFRA